MHPNAGVAANNLAWIYAEEGIQLDLALQLAQTAKAQLPERGDVSDTLGWVYHKKGMSSSAVQPLLEAVEKEPRNPHYRYHLGVVYSATGDRDKAREMLQRALELSSDFNGAEDAKRVLAGLSSHETAMTR
jgi:tetratricopeptide (TPR) repeat protein